MKILEWLTLPEKRNINDLDDPATTALHGRIIAQKPFLKNIYIDFYQKFQEALGGQDGPFVELGSGAGFIKDVLPQVYNSDILAVTNIDIRLSMEALPFEDNTVGAFLMLDVFHHVKDPLKVLKEMTRCLKPGGKIVMIEPANTLWGRWIYQNFHHERFDPTAGWTVEGEGPLSDANGAIPWIVFCRDREKFAQELPSLRIKRISPHTPFRYLISGGVSFKQLLPSWCYPLVMGLEIVLTVFHRWLGMFYTIELHK